MNCFSFPVAAPRVTRASAAGLALYMALAQLAPAARAADDDGLFATTNANPFIQIYSLPSPSMAAASGPGRWAWRVELDIANNALQENGDASERVVLDGETYRSSFSLSRTLSDEWSGTVTVPLVAHGGGFLDGLVRDWHDLFGLTNSRRDEFRDGSLNYEYGRDGGDAFRLAERSRGVGDVRLMLDRKVHTADPRRRMSVRAGLKLPTGSSEDLHGSGSTDVSLQWLGTDAATLAARRLTLAWMIGGLWLGDGEVLDGLRREFVAIGSLGVSRPVWGRVVARLQLDGHSSFYDTALRPLGARSVQLSFGASIALARAGRIDVALIENLFTDTTPDVVLHLAWRGAF